MNKKLFSVIVFLAVIAMLVSSCAQPTAVPAPAATEAPKAAPAEATKAPEPTAAPLAELTYVYVGGPQKDQQAVNDTLNAITKEKINATIKLVPYDWSAFTDKVNLMFSSNEQCDVIWNAPWQAPNHNKLVTDGSLADMTPLLQNNAPELMKAMPPNAWAATTVGGKIYGVPFMETWTKRFGTAVRKDLADKYKLDVSKLAKYEDLEPFLATLKANEPDITPIPLPDGTPNSLWMAEIAGYDVVVDQDVQVAVKFDDQAGKMVNAFESPEFKAMVELAHKWYQAGYIAKDLVPAADMPSQWKTGKYAVAVAAQELPGKDLEFKNANGFEAYLKSFVPTPFKATGSVSASQTSICANSKNPDAAAKFINLFQTDPAVYNLLAYGIEGKHWTWADKATNLIDTTLGKDLYAPNSNWMFGATPLAYYTDKNLAAIKSADQMAKLNADAPASVALGFAFDPTAVKTEVAQVAAVVKEQGYPLINGKTDPATALPKFIASLKAAGMDAVVAETQKQFDAWKASK